MPHMSPRRVKRNSAHAYEQQIIKARRAKPLVKSKKQDAPTAGYARFRSGTRYCGVHVTSRCSRG